MGQWMKPSILIADDEKVICEGLERLLSAEYEIYTTYNGKDALDIIRRHKDIVVLLCDIMMPVMDGVEMIKKVRSENKVTCPQSLYHIESCSLLQVNW